MKSVEVWSQTSQSVEVTREEDETTLDHLHHRNIRDNAGAGEVTEVHHGITLHHRLSPHPGHLHQSGLGQVSQEVEHFLGARVEGGVDSNKCDVLVSVCDCCAVG